MGFGRKLGKTLLLGTKAAQRMGDGMDRVFGENRTRPEDGFSKDRAGQRAARFTEKARESSKGSLSKSRKDEKKRKFLSDDDDRDFI